MSNSLEGIGWRATPALNAPGASERGAETNGAQAPPSSAFTELRRAPKASADTAAMRLRSPLPSIPKQQGLTAPPALSAPLPAQANDAWSPAQKLAFDHAGKAGMGPSDAIQLTRVVAIKEQVDSLTAKLPEIRLTQPETASRIEQLAALFDQALLARDVYYNESVPGLLPKGCSRLSEAELAGLNLSQKDLVNEKSGYFAAVYKTGEGRYLLVNRGTEAGKEGRRDWGANFKQGVGLGSHQHTQAMHAARRITQAAPGQVSFAGHSLGGGLAQAQALVTGHKATVFNAAGLHSRTVKPFDTDLSNARKLISAHNVRGEVLSTMQDAAGKLMPSARGERQRLSAVRTPQEADGLQWSEGRMGRLSAAKHTVGLHSMDSVIASLGWQLNQLQHAATP